MQALDLGLLYAMVDNEPGVDDFEYIMDMWVNGRWVNVQTMADIQMLSK